MEIKILDSEYVFENGVNYDDLELEIFTDRLLDPITGKGYTGLVYEGYYKAFLIDYAFYINGLMNGYSVDFYENGNVEKMFTMKNGSANGVYRIWNEENVLIEEGEYMVGVHIKYRKYDVKGKLIEEKKGPSERQIELIDAIKNRK